MCCDVESYTCIECEIIRIVHISVNVVAGFLLLPLLSHNSWGLVQEMMLLWFATYSPFIAADQAYYHSRQFPPKLKFLVPGRWYLNRCDFVLPMCLVVSGSVLFYSRHIVRQVVLTTLCGGEQHFKLLADNLETSDAVSLLL